MLHPNRDGRERALELLYEAEARGVEVTELLAEQVVSSEFAKGAVEGTSRELEKIDGLIAHRSKDWAVSRLAAVDRALLRLAVWELLEHREVSAAVVISEAVELAGIFSTEKSKKFVNGLLAAIAADLGRS